jgi:dihydrofolate reductase
LFDNFIKILYRNHLEITSIVGTSSFPSTPCEHPTLFIFSRTLRQEDYPNVTVVSENPEDVLADLRPKPGKDIWLFGGGLLFRSLLEARLVDAVEASVVPVLLREGIPRFPPKTSSERFRLKLASSRAFKSGIVSLEYAVEYDPA